MLRLFAGVLLAVGSSLIGLALKRHYRQRDEIYSSACEFLQMLKLEIETLKTPVGVVVDEFCSQQSLFSNVLKSSFENYIKKNKPVVLERTMLAQLNLAERKELEKFLNSVGKLPLRQQLSELDKWTFKFSACQKKTAEESKRLGSMYLKLCVLLGVALMIIVL